MMAEDEAAIINLYLNSLKSKKVDVKLKYSTDDKSSYEQPNLKDIIKDAKHMMMKDRYQKHL